MARSRETYNKKEVRKKKENKKKKKEKKRLEKKENEKKDSLDDMIAYVDENGNITDTPPYHEEKETIDAEDIEVGIPKQDPSQKPNKMREGRITYFNFSKGFGFIEDSETRERVFLHINDVDGDIDEDSMVSYRSEKGSRGPVAKEVILSKDKGSKK